MEILSALLESWSEILSDPASLYNCSRGVSESLKTLILPFGILLALGWRYIPERLASRTLLVLVVLSTLNYARWGERTIMEKVDVYDLSHYYLNSRYFDELGYYDLYPAMILADHSNDGPYFRDGNKYMAQNAAGHGIKPISHALQRGQWVRDNQFSPERWEQFQHDALYIQREIPGFSDKLWREMIQDHGYNGTPPWTTLARPLSSIVPVESIKLLGFLDLGLLAAATGATAWAFGAPTAGWLWIFLMCGYSTRWPTITWSYLRYDYISALIFGMALIKKGRYLLAGVMTGWAATMRLFPAMWLYGPGMKGLVGLTGLGLKERVVRRPLLVLAGGFLLGVGVLQGIAVADLGAEQVQVHFENMIDHNSSEQLSSRRIGLALALPYYPGQDVPKYIEAERKEKIEAQKPLRFGIAAGVMLLLGFGLRSARDEETYAVGFIPFFLLTTASYYYYVARATLIIMHGADLSKWRNRIGLAWLLGLEWFMNMAETVWPGERVLAVGGLAWGIAIYTVGLTIWLLVESRHAQE